MRRWLSLPLLSLAATLSCTVQAFAQNDVVGHVIAGYQGWFAQPGDGSPVGNVPRGTGNYHGNFETYPDLREFPDSEQFVPTNNLGPMPNGNPSRLFSSARPFTAEKHAEWMKQYGVEVAAIQRFFEVTRSDLYAQQKDYVTKLMRDACQRNGRKFYIEYDTSGSGKDSTTWTEAIQKDWTRFAVGEKIIGASSYARQNGKPVVEIWGMGLNGNNTCTDPAQWLALIQWFKKQGVYVIGGTPTGWNSQGGYKDCLPGFDPVFAACDAINPWVVGRYSTNEGADKYASGNLTPERDWCKAHNIDYIPCVFAGTSFFNSNHRTKNVIPRRGGQLMWRQFANLRNLGISTCFISMFDEFNEATEIAKTAEDASQIPTEPWFLPLDADGTSLSADFYLRLTRDAGNMLKGKTPMQWDLPTPPRNDLLATSFESSQPQPTADSGLPKNVSGTACNVRTGEKAQSGTASLLFSGTANGSRATTCSYTLFDYASAPKVIDENTRLYYWLYPRNENGRFIAVDLHFTDGTTLHQSKCIDQNGRALGASAGHGGQIPLNAWSCITSDLSSLAGKKIDKVLVTFDHAGATGPYQGYIDDISLSH